MIVFGRGFYYNCNVKNNYYFDYALLCSRNVRKKKLSVVSLTSTVNLQGGKEDRQRISISVPQ